MVKKVLITGGSGMLGAHVIGSGNNQTEWYSISRADNQNYKADFTPVVYDLAESDEIPVLEGLDAIVHCANSRYYKEFDRYAHDIFNVNIMSTFKLLEYGKKLNIKKFVYISTGGVYDLSAKTIDEKTSVLINGPEFYSGSKLCAEIMVNSYRKYFNVTILRMFFPYGKGQNQQNLFPGLIRKIKSGEEVVLHGSNTGIKLNPIYSEDAAGAVVKAIDLEGNHVINVGGDEILSIRDICGIIGKKLDKPVNYRYDKLPAAQQTLVCDISLMKKLLITPKYRFKDKIETLLI
ncbi:MAG: NAD(P)-dependent oxidoreductase [Eubacteriales bacterium]|nr:NAD(P)-dependent oxidoreductase [Eubacteriales bacterium]